MKILRDGLCAGLCAMVLAVAPAFAKTLAQDMAATARATPSVPGGKRGMALPAPKAPTQTGTAVIHTRRAHAARNTDVVAPGGVENLHWGRAALSASATPAKPGGPEFVIHNSDGSEVDGPSDEGAKAKSGKTTKSQR